MYLSRICDFLWSGPILLLLLSSHLFLTFKFFPQRKLFYALKLSVRPEDDKMTDSGTGGTPEKQTHGMNGFQALATTLAATLGTGNIVGVSTAIALGGPGAKPEKEERPAPTPRGRSRPWPRGLYWARG